MSSRFAVVPAAYVLFLRTRDGRDEALMQLRRNTGYLDGHWTTAAAGHVEAGESVFDAARREAEEEIGVTDLTLQPLCAMHRTYGDEPINQRVDYFLRATAWRGEPTIREPQKCADLGWFPLDDLPDPVVPHELQVFDALRDGTLEPIVTNGF
jgi:8-oxo-dGTP pyrophosphatase MutT (NUDIX family)